MEWHRREPEPLPWTERPSAFPSDMATLVAIMIELLLFGVYTCLFFASLYIMLERQNTRSIHGKIFFASALLLYLIATSHNTLNLYRALRAFIFLRDDVHPITYFMDMGRWDNYAHNIILCLMAWIGDGLVIYRCFIIWNCNYTIIVIPTLLLVAAIAVNSALLYAWEHPNAIGPKNLVHMLNTVYPLCLAQNTLTTGLISLKIYNQHRLSHAAGLRNFNSSMINILRIVIESAMLYTFQLLLLIILYCLGHNAQFVFQYATVPTIGIVFNLIAVRVHLSLSRTRHPTAIISAISNWSDDHLSSDEPLDQGAKDAQTKPAESMKLNETPGLAIRASIENMGRSKTTEMYS